LNFSRTDSATPDPTWLITFGQSSLYSFSPCPKVVCAGGLRPSLGSPLPGGAGLVFLSFESMLLLDGMVGYAKSCEKFIF
jgi:hypothetical protein